MILPNKTYTKYNQAGLSRVLNNDFNGKVTRNSEILSINP